MLTCLELENKSFEDLYIKFYGMKECSSNYSYGPAIRDHYIIHYCLSGKGNYYIHNKVYAIEAGDVFLTPPHTLFSYQVDSINPWTYMWIGLDGKKISNYLNLCHLDKDHLIIHYQDIDTVKEIMNSMLAHHSLSHNNELYLQSKVFELFSLFVSKNNLMDTSSQTYVIKAIEYIQNNYQNRISISELAKYLSLNRSYLTTLFKQHIGLSPQEYLLDYRMNQSTNLLLKTNLTIQQIAYSCGYVNQLSFSKAFRLHYHMAPREYRHKYRQIKT